MVLLTRSRQDKSNDINYKQSGSHELLKGDGAHLFLDSSWAYFNHSW